ncbi:Uncharacterized protein APZ42_028512 [Daphnia magna]|uniref:Uncharacterized protein n=1 Tax=Daphnia magna TaxID=35525 RepID=A0A164QFW7_9CRUS|nr:Uncharacterized protein APZ42_028512 [Daphnia magna]
MGRECDVSAESDASPESLTARTIFCSPSPQYSNGKN